MKKLGCALLVALCHLPDVRAAVFTVDTANSSASFEVGYFAHGKVKGVLSHLVGTVELDGNSKVGSGDIIFDMTMVETGSAMTNRFIKSGSIFDSKKYPTMLFHVNRFDFDGDRLQAVTGDLILHGVSRGVRLEARQFSCPDLPDANGVFLPCRGEFATLINRTHFGMNSLRLLVDDDVTINVILTLERIIFKTNP